MTDNPFPPGAGPPPTTPYWFSPAPWTCARCGDEFGIPEWQSFMSPFLDHPLRPLTVPYCKRCFGHLRLMDVMFQLGAEVEPFVLGERIGDEEADDD